MAGTKDKLPAPSPRTSFRLVLAMLCMVSIPAAITLHTVRAPAGMNAPADTGDFGDACAAVVRVEAAHDQPVCFQPVQQ